MASGDPGTQNGEGLKVGDMVVMSGMSADGSSFSAGLSLVRAGIWPRIGQAIAQMGAAGAPRGVAGHGNVVHLLPRRRAPDSPMASFPGPKSCTLLAAE
ncbi:MAG: hypothetical protein ACT4N9_08025 [Paracoccaceae bacterium]